MFLRLRTALCFTGGICFHDFRQSPPCPGSDGLAHGAPEASVRNCPAALLRSRQHPSFASTSPRVFKLKMSVNFGRVLCNHCMWFAIGRWLVATTIGNEGCRSPEPVQAHVTRPWVVRSWVDCANEDNSLVRPRCMCMCVAALQAFLCFRSR